MKTREAVQIGLVNYIKAPIHGQLLHRTLESKQIHFFKDMDDKQIIEHLQKMAIPDAHKFGLFARGDDGLKRAKFLLFKLNEWEEQKLSSEELLSKTCILYSDNREPPYGLGNSKLLRFHLALALSEILGVKRGQIKDEEIKKTYDQLYVIPDADALSDNDPEHSWEPTREKIINEILFEKANKTIFRIVNDPSSRVAFLSGSHARLGKNSSLRALVDNTLFDKNVIPLVFELAGIDKLSVKKVA